mgnify:CR=1 FL=1
MHEILVEIGENGKVKILYKGFKGGACFDEAKRLYEALKAQGVEVSLEQVTPTQELYETVEERQRMVQKHE